MGVIKIEYHGDIVKIIIDNPPDNLITKEFLEKIDEIIGKIGNKILMFKGENNMFSKGLDRSIFLEMDEHSILNYLKFIRRIFRRIYLHNNLVISVIEGYAIDEGFELMLMSDIIFSDANAMIGYKKFIDGIPFSLTGFTRIVNRTCYRDSLKILLKGLLNAEEAFEYGLVDYISKEPYREALSFINDLLEKFGLERLSYIKDFYKEKFIHGDASLNMIEEEILERMLYKEYLKKFI